MPRPSERLALPWTGSGAWQKILSGPKQNEICFLASQPINRPTDPTTDLIALRLQLTRGAKVMDLVPRTHSFLHANDRQRLSILQWHVEISERDIASGSVEWHSGQGCTHFKSREAGGSSGSFTGLENHAANSTAHPVRMDKKSANLCSVVLRIQQRVLSAGPTVATKECLAFAPAAAADDNRLRSRLDDVIGSIRDQLAIHTVDGLQCAFDLGRSVIGRLQSADGRINQRGQDA